jgi:UDP-N-acetylmuramyl pentapeptide phosphotransferase/UDP-N-acetylglucosamine-1-phosphate transferase
MAEKQIDFPELQKEDPRVTPYMLGISLLCVIVVIVLLLADVDGPFIGPWG